MNERRKLIGMPRYKLEALKEELEWSIGCMERAVDAVQMIRKTKSPNSMEYQLFTVSIEHGEQRIKGLQDKLADVKLYISLDNQQKGIERRMKKLNFQGRVERLVVIEKQGEIKLKVREIR